MVPHSAQSILLDREYTFLALCVNEAGQATTVGSGDTADGHFLSPDWQLRGVVRPPVAWHLYSPEWPLTVILQNA